MNQKRSQAPEEGLRNSPEETPAKRYFPSSVKNLARPNQLWVLNRAGRFLLVGEGEAEPLTAGGAHEAIAEAVGRDAATEDAAASDYNPRPTPFDGATPVSTSSE